MITLGEIGVKLMGYAEEHDFEVGEDE